MKIKLTKIQIIVMIADFILGVTFLALGIILNNKTPNPTPTPPNPSLPDKELLGEDRVKAQDEIIKVIEKYINDNANVIEYLKTNKITTISVKELKEELKIDISEFENLSYGCNSEFTTIDFSEDYSEHIISLTCDAFFKENE